MDRHMLEFVSSDLLFAVVFGRLAHVDIRSFALHGGPLGLKIAALQLIGSAEYLSLGATLRSKGPLREALAMLEGLAS